MKTLRLLGMALVGVVMCGYFTSCSSDDDGDNGDTPVKNDDGIVTNQKKLIEMKETDEDDTNTFSFSYDSKGRLISVVEKDYDSSNSDIINITWGENSVTENEDGESIAYSLTDGLARTGVETNGRNYSFAYNSSKQLTTYQYGDKYYSRTRTLTWENGKVIKIAYDKDISEFTYGSQTCKGYFPLMATMVEDDFKVMIAHPELVGMRATQLPEQSYYKEGDYETTSKFAYKLDKDGYLDSCTENYTEKNVSSGTTYTYTTIYTFKWE